MNLSLATLPSSKLLPVLFLLRQLSLQCTLVYIPTLNPELFGLGHLLVNRSNNVTLHMHHAVDDLLVVLNNVVVYIPQRAQKLRQFRALFVQVFLEDELAVEAHREEAGVDDGVVQIEEDGEQA